MENNNSSGSAWFIKLSSEAQNWSVFSVKKSQFET